MGYHGKLSFDIFRIKAIVKRDMAGPTSALCSITMKKLKRFGNFLKLI
jgi:hypothetical protein